MFITANLYGIFNIRVKKLRPHFVSRIIGAYIYCFQIKQIYSSANIKIYIYISIVILILYTITNYGIGTIVGLFIELYIDFDNRN